MVFLLSSMVIQKVKQLTVKMPRKHWFFVVNSRRQLWLGYTGKESMEEHGRTRAPGWTGVKPRCPKSQKTGPMTPRGLPDGTWTPGSAKG